MEKINEQERKLVQRHRLFIALVGLDILLLVYVIYQLIALFIL